MTELEDARAVELRRTIAELRPRVDSHRKRASGRVTRLRSTGSDLLFQGTAQAVGTLTAGAIAYLVAIAAGALDGTRPLTILLTSILLAGACASLFTSRWFILPSKRAELKLMNASLELRQIELRVKVESGQALSVEELGLVATGLVNLDGLKDPYGGSEA